MKDLITLENTVEEVLTNSYEARNSVWSLYYEVCKVKCPNVMNAKFGTALKSHDEYNLPPFESVARCRRKVVEKRPDLAGCDEVEGGRWSSEQKFKTYARGCV